MKLPRVITIDLNSLHFCRDDKVRYRKHLTTGVVIASVLGMIGTVYGVAWMLHVATAVNAGTALIWIWE